MRIVTILLLLSLGAGLILAQGGPAQPGPGQRNEVQGGQAQGSQPDVPYTLNVDVALVTVDVGIADSRGKPILNLTREDFNIYEDGQLQKLGRFASAGAPYSVLLLVDHSGSMRNQWSFVVEAMNRFIARLRQQDQVAIATFDNVTEIAMDWRSALGNQKTEQINLGDLRNGTNLFGAIYWASQEIQPRDGRKAVVVYTDGIDDRLAQDAKSREMQFLLKAVRDSEAHFYFVGVDTSTSIGGARIKDMVDVSGGKTFFPRRPEEVGPLYERIATDMGSTYTLGYYPSKPLGDGKYRRIEVRPLDVRLRVTQSRDGYEAK